jgi:hypothetical protein
VSSIVKVISFENGEQRECQPFSLACTGSTSARAWAEIHALTRQALAVELERHAHLGPQASAC